MVRRYRTVLGVLAGGLVGVVAVDAGEAPAAPAWTATVSPVNSIRSDGNGYEIKARTNTYAHLVAPGRDFVRLTGSIKPGAGVSWCTSLFVYWGPGDWCQMGVLQENGGRYYVTEMIDGR